MISLAHAATEQTRLHNALSVNRFLLIAQGLLLRWHAMATLSLLSDRGLRDIGLTRDDVMSIARDTSGVDQIEQTRLRQSRNW
ncbi:DUF1127 domain-containing protein [Ruegeria pomeroyi]|uniref:DUF1127 domain-containing protein n=1 Tax=Ruegeria alba TaxID=2916756 RepID=A0ABS9NZT3_9RHOB|nr:DUF1127 domain-containing protein [Ruegeria alba]MCE8523316.1 DUF1127 domain-containing protein [Ruegeria pomeroyi]MCE8535556.1 DUF1127 domain-containing protein [Ruegeria pomeroyi]MCE8556050.1 DUF1127 domain-containing protein [Ruegeria pomeroyi]MCG6559748.1 DUF1127 domain-containing protein [Ruegeria alba]